MFIPLVIVCEACVLHKLFENVNKSNKIRININQQLKIGLYHKQVGKALQPSVIYIGDCEKMFKKKIPKTDPVSYIIGIVIYDKALAHVHHLF